MLEHGGRLDLAARRFGIPREDWLDLSTGIAPWSYQLPPPPQSVWQRLPEEDDGLDAAALAYFGAPGLAVPGSQWALRMLPRLLPPGRVAMRAPLYAEHPLAWRAAGHTPVAWAEPAEYAVVCRPNNPTGEILPRDEPIGRAQRLRLLVVDEAFIDATPDQTLLGAQQNLVVLRSLGKFFGLAGVRAGFVFGPVELIENLRAALGPWAVSHLARWAARLALTDRRWQALQRERLVAAAARLASLLNEHGLANDGTALFRYAPTSCAPTLFEALARRGILVRRFDAPPALRFGLPGREADWQRLALALKEVV